MPHDPKAVANYFLDLAEADRRSLTPMQVRNLVYFANGWHLAIEDRPLIAENVMAWDYGPVIRSLLDAFPEHGQQTIGSRAVDYTLVQDESGKMIVREYEPSIGRDGQETAFTRPLLGRVWDVYGHFTGIQLSNMTHVPGSPWLQVFEAHDGEIPPGTVIPPETMGDYFRSLAEARAQHGVPA